MSFRRQLCCLAVPRRVKAPTPTEHQLWITDDIFNDSLSRSALAALSRKHGSFVPGPLEARRRAAKRRMVNLAKTGGGVVNEAILFSETNHDQYSNEWQWKPPSISLAPVPPQQGQECKLVPSSLTIKIGTDNT